MTIGVPTDARPPARAFEHGTVLEIHALACELGLAERRAVLVGSLSHRMRAELIDPSRRADQLLSDLLLLNAWVDVDGAAPLLAEWLRTAARLTEHLPRGRRFAEWASHAARAPAPRVPAAQFEAHPELRAARRRISQLQAARGAGAVIRAAMDELRAIKRRIRSGGSLEAGDVLADRFVLGERVGGGGFASVWRAFDEQRGAEVAVKVLHGRWNRDQSRIERFRRGARKMAQLADVPGVVDVITGVESDEHWHFYAMEFLDGGDLDGAVLRPEPLPAVAGLGAVLAAADALGEAHRRGMVHRDIKPSNILLDGAGRAKLSDFDLVLADDTTGGTGTGALGTLLYAAPELLDRPGDAGPAADVYGLAMAAIFVLHRAELPRSMIRRPDAILAALPVHDAVRDVLRQSIAWHPERRPRDGSAFADDLRRALDRSDAGVLGAANLIAGSTMMMVWVPEGADATGLVTHRGGVSGGPAASAPDAGGFGPTVIEWDPPVHRPSAPVAPTPLITPPSLPRARPVGAPPSPARRGRPQPRARSSAPSLAPRAVPVQPPAVVVEPVGGPTTYAPPGGGDGPQRTDPAIAPVQLAGASPHPEPPTALRPALVYIAPGRFEMGSPVAEWGRRGDEQRHTVTLTAGFWMAVAPISGAGYRRLTGTRRGRWDPSSPVTSVTWVMAARCCNRLSAAEGLQPAYAIDGRAATLRPGADGYRLPTEAQWEYACRAGTTTRYWCGDAEHEVEAVAVYQRNARRCAEPSGARSANPWGLFDMHGNVWEWCHDIFGLYDTGAVSDPIGPAAGARRVVRGGAYNTELVELRSASRRGQRPDDDTDDVGFRVVRPG